MNSPDTRGLSLSFSLPGRVAAVIVSDRGEIPVSFIGLDALVKNKRASGRPKDLDDLSYLTREH